VRKLLLEFIVSIELVILFDLFENPINPTNPINPKVLNYEDNEI